ncbi:MAG: hypothetical protein L3K03_08985 [Thermoplasmata archaeon]|nr:hypothetical protein [Thermoplasmata archaeon]
MAVPVREVARTSWIVAPPEPCILCREPLGPAHDTSSWNGKPAHRECVRIHMLQNDPAFREGGAGEETTEDPSESMEEGTMRDDDEFG